MVGQTSAVIGTVVLAGVYLLTSDPYFSAGAGLIVGVVVFVIGGMGMEY